MTACDRVPSHLLLCGCRARELRPNLPRGHLNIHTSHTRARSCAPPALSLIDDGWLAVRRPPNISKAVGAAFQQHGVAVYYTAGEAYRETASYCTSHNCCAVLAKDSDYFVLPVPAYLNLDTLQLYAEPPTVTVYRRADVERVQQPICPLRTRPRPCLHSPTPPVVTCFLSCPTSVAGPRSAI